jgi:plasmid stability protein
VQRTNFADFATVNLMQKAQIKLTIGHEVIACLRNAITKAAPMPALTIRNIPDDVHRGLKALAARHGRSAEAEVRELIAAAVKPEGRLRMGEALAAIWAPLAMTDEELAVIEGSRDRAPANPVSFDE